MLYLQCAVPKKGFEPSMTGFAKTPTWNAGLPELYSVSDYPRSARKPHFATSGLNHTEFPDHLRVRWPSILADEQRQCNVRMGTSESEVSYTRTAMVIARSPQPLGIAKRGRVALTQGWNPIRVTFRNKFNRTSDSGSGTVKHGGYWFCEFHYDLLFAEEQLHAPDL